MMQKPKFLLYVLYLCCMKFYFYYVFIHINIICFFFCYIFLFSYYSIDYVCKITLLFSLYVQICYNTKFLLLGIRIF